MVETPPPTVDELQQEIVQIRQINTQLESKVQEMNQRIEHLQSSKELDEEANDKMMEQFEKELAVANDKIALLESSQGNNPDLSASIEMQSTIVRLKEENAKLVASQQQMQAASSKSQDLETQIHQLKEEKSAMQKIIDQNTELAKKQEASERSRLDLESKMSQMESDLKHHLEERNALQDQLSKLQKQDAERLEAHQHGIFQLEHNFQLERCHSPVRTPIEN